MAETKSAWHLSGLLACALLLPAAAQEAVAPAAAPAPVASGLSGEAGWVLRPPPELERVAFRGVASFDTVSSGTGDMLYPAPNMAGFLAAVITHGLISEATRNSAKERVQAQADQVLGPYQTVLQTYSHTELFGLSVRKMATKKDIRVEVPMENPVPTWRIDSVPLFLLTQDQSAIILDHSISIYDPDKPLEPVYQNTVRIVSKAADVADVQAFWTANQGARLKEESAALYAQSLDLALGDMAGNYNATTLPQKTVRYVQGRAEQMERGQLIAEHCDRVVIKNLRGWIMSLPRTPGSLGTCPSTN